MTAISARQPPRRPDFAEVLRGFTVGTCRIGGGEDFMGAMLGVRGVLRLLEMSGIDLGTLFFIGRAPTVFTSFRS